MLQTKHIFLRLITEEDIGFLLSLRLNISLNKYLGRVDNDREQQLKWLLDYKKREALGEDYYFIIMDKQLGAVGMVRVYNIDYENYRCNWGSWILKEDRPKYAALDSMLLSYEFVFNELGLNLCKFKVHTANIRARSFYERFGSQKVGEDELETFFELSKYQYIQLKYLKYYKYFLS